MYLAHKMTIASIILFTSFLNQQKVETFFIVDKGVYVKLKEGEKRIKVPYKKGVLFYFSIKNDSTVFVQEISNKKLKQVEQYRLSHNYDTSYVKRYSYDSSGNPKLILQKMVFRKVYKEGFKLVRD